MTFIANSFFSIWMQRNRIAKMQRWNCPIMQIRISEILHPIKTGDETIYQIYSYSNFTFILSLNNRLIYRIVFLSCIRQNYHYVIFNQSHVLRIHRSSVDVWFHIVSKRLHLQSLNNEKCNYWQCKGGIICGNDKSIWWLYMIKVQTTIEDTIAKL